MLGTPIAFIRTRRTRIPNPACDWVAHGMGRPQPLYDGLTMSITATATRIEHHLQPGEPPPIGFTPADTPETPHQGWRDIATAQTRHQTAYNIARNRHPVRPIPHGHYELIGPGLAKNPHKLPSHHLMPHHLPDSDLPPEFTEPDIPHAYDDIATWITRHPHLAGILWTHQAHPDRYALMRRRDFQ